MKKYLLLFVLMVLIGGGCFRGSSDPKAEIGSSRFGRLVGGPVTESRIDGGWVRPHPGPFWWDQIETSQDVYDWSVADQTVKYWQERDQAILATLWPFAQWDQERCHTGVTPKVKHPFGTEEVWLSSVCHNESYEEWVRNVVERYDGDGVDDMPGLKYPISHWEIGNEPDLQTQDLSFFQSSPDGYSELYRLAYSVIKAADPNATLLFAGMSSMSAQAQHFWKFVFESERDRADIFNIHSIAASEQFFSKEYHEYLDKNARLGPTYWITEALVGAPFLDYDEDGKAQLTVASYAQAFANGAERIFNVGKHNPSQDPGDASERAFELTVKMLDGFESVEWIGQESIVKFGFSDKTVYVMWDATKLPLTVEGEVETVRYDGVKKRTDARQVVAEKPMFVIVR